MSPQTEDPTNNNMLKNSSGSEALVDEGLKQHSRGNLAEAENSYKRVLAQDPLHPIALHYLGVIALQANNLNLAVDLIQRAIQQSPEYVEAYSNLGNAYQAQGKFKEAIDCFETTLMLTKNSGLPNPEVLANLGNAYAQIAVFDIALEHYEKAIAIAKAQGRELPEVHRNLANTYLQLGLTTKALASINQANRVQQNNLAIQLTMSNILHEAGRHDDAVSCYLDILKRHPNSPQIHTNLGNVLRYIGQINEALTHYNMAIEIDRTFDEAFYNRAVAHMENGDMEESKADANRAIELNPLYGKAHGLLAGFADSPASLNTSLSALQSAFAQQDLAAKEKTYLAFALGKTLEGLEQYDKAFAYYRLANTLKRKSIKFNTTREASFFVNLKQVTEPKKLKNLTRLQPLERAEITPIFIIGMPRSGTTLVEQILASHPEIHAAGELSYFPECISAELATVNDIDYTAALGQATPESISRIAQNYLKKLAALKPESRYVTDKLPMNFLHLGLIKMTFPNDTIIHCQRHPLDTCLSIYKNLFVARGHNYSYDLTELGTFYAAYKDLMAFWRESLPNFVYESSYEKLVQEQEQESRKLIDACGLDWHSNCLDFHNTKRRILTLSATQVRKPMYNKSVGFWRNYQRGLAPLIEILGIE
jgi:tetratricopeptide (TPR) repeat protein